MKQQSYKKAKKSSINTPSNYKILDVGCGANPKGDVNIDLFPNQKDQCIIPWDPKKIKNFILADAEHLPFRTQTFKKLYAFHVLEHIKNPMSALKEWKRVATITVIRVPSAYDLDKTKTHFYTWNESTLKNLLETVYENVQISYTHQKLQLSGKYAHLLRYIANRFPKEIESICWS